MPIVLTKRGSNPDPAFDISGVLNDQNMTILEGAVSSLEANDTLQAGQISARLLSSDPSVTNRREIAQKDYAAFIVDAAGNASLYRPALVASLLTMTSTEAGALGAVILAESTVIPTSATFRTWRDGTSAVALFTPITYKALTSPIAYAYTGTTMTLDFGDAGGGDPDLGKIRTLNPRITGVTGNLSLIFAGFLDSTMLGQEVCVEMVSNSAGSKTLGISAGAGQTITSLVGVTPIALGAVGKRVYVWVRFVSNTQIDVIAWGATP